MMMMMLLLDVIVVLVKKMFKMRYVYMFFDVRFSVVVSRVPFVSKISLARSVRIEDLSRFHVSIDFVCL